MRFSLEQAAKQTSSVHYLWLECAQYKNSESQTVQMQSESQSLWFCLLGFDPFDLFCLMSLVSRLQHVRGRFFFLHVVWIKKRRNIQDFCISSNLTLHLQQFISLGIWEQIRKENLRKRVPLLSIHFSSGRSTFVFSFNLSLVRFSLVQFSSVSLSWVSGPGSRKKPTVSVSVCSLRLSSTASRSCPSLQSTPGSCRHTGRSRWSRGCCDRRKHGWEPEKKT